MTSKPWPAAEYLPTHTLHAVYAAGGPADGSLYGFFTFCKRRVGDEEVWREVDRSHLPIGAVHHCKQCQKALDRAKNY